MPRFGSIGVMSLFSLNGFQWVQQVALGKTPADWAPHLQWGTAQQGKESQGPHGREAGMSLPPLVRQHETYCVKSCD